MSEVIYTGEDTEVVIDLVDVNFADLADLIVGVVINKNLCKVSKKSLPGNDQVLPHDEPTKCILRLLRNETRTWPLGMLSLEVTIVTTDSRFPAGKHTIFRENIVLFQNAYTKNQ